MKKSMSILVSMIFMVILFNVIPSSAFDSGNDLVSLIESGDEGTEITVLEFEDFESGISGWGPYVDAKVNFNISQGQAESKALAVQLDYDPSLAYNWNEFPMVTSPAKSGTVGDATNITFDIYLDSVSDYSGSMQITPIIHSPEHSYWFPLSGVDLRFSAGTAIEGTSLTKYTITQTLVNQPELGAITIEPTDRINQVTFVLGGVNTNYDGDIYIDNIKFVKYESPDAPLSINKISIKNEYSLMAGDDIKVTCTSAGGTSDYQYTFYAVNDGVVYYNTAFIDENTVTFPLNDAGEYKIIVYCKDALGTKVKNIKTITVYDPKDIPVPDKMIALTFDDGTFATTPLLLDILEEKDVKATFFMLGSNAQNSKDSILAVYQAGHQIGNHTYTHDYLTNMTQEEAVADMNKNADLIESVTGIRPTVYRPPYLAYNSTVLSWFSDMKAIGCSVDSRDWSGVTKEEIVSIVVNYANDGAIVLLHEPLQTTRDAVPEIIDQLRAKGYEFVTVDEIFQLRGKTYENGCYYSNAY